MRASTRNPSAIPAAKQLERLLVALATLDAILSPEWQFRYYSFNKDWDNSKGHRMGSMRNGSPPKGVLDNFPDSIEDFLTESAFSMENTTFCLWRLPEETWSVGPVDFPDGEDPDGSEFLLELLSGVPEDYLRFASEYHEAEIPLESIQSIYQHEPLTDELVRSLNSETSLTDLANDLAEIGYPLATA